MVKHNSGAWWLLGDSSTYHFHGNGLNDIFVSNHAHTNIKSGSQFFKNGSTYDLYGTWPTTHAILSLVTSGPVQANNFSNDRNIGGRMQMVILPNL